MKRISTIVIAMAIGSSALMAQEIVNVKSVTPAPGYVERCGTPNLVFDAIPVPNPDCNQEAQLYHNSKLISSIFTGESARLQRFQIGQSDNSCTLVFNSKGYTEPGVYEVKVPQGFFTFSDGEKISGAYSCTYTIADPSEITFAPEGGTYKYVPNVIKLTIPGVVEIIDNHQPTDDELQGNIGYFTPSNTLHTEETTPSRHLDMKIEGNTITFTAGDKPFTEIGNYMLIVYRGALTLVYPDGTTSVNPQYRVDYGNSVVPFPRLRFLTGARPGDDDKEQDMNNIEVYEIGEVELEYPEEITFRIFMANPSLYDGTSYSNWGTRIASWNIDRSVPFNGKSSVRFTPPTGTAFRTPGQYLFCVGRSSFSAYGPFYDPQYYGSSESDPDYDPEMDPFAGKDKGALIEAWNNTNIVYRVTVLESPANIKGNDSFVIDAVESFPIYFPNAKTIEFPYTAPAEAPSIRDRFWREQKGYKVTLEIGTPSVEAPEAANIARANAAEKVCTAFVKIDPPFRPEKSGDYTIYIPAGSFVCDGVEDSREFSQIVTIDPSVTGIFTPEVAPAESEAAQKVTVVTLDGVTILRDADPTELFNIPAGLYIINGQRTLLR